ncbi:acyl-CoA N-acyltransferase [Gloeophyllum trabeum ATCC 11539]|uniref:Acyl-CoA N-acyltransferase n=1 Tax=Gloeophyllum trabeum (strain ATCC 11539 / FP-39264 / Madison 617) TaxID=670483 RepID=S7RQB0_GLOTA|nr:acyl-CoA N-acyltransferase [Gloeophyllum trabeum ATCC 11539]EPQ55084.1 acyl-CoA N-acyltransferase [Gloeophyllum trabeum ATCC 11539]
MSAYGAIQTRSRPDTVLPSTAWTVQSKDGATTGYVTIHHLNLAHAQAFEDLLDYLWHVFAEEVDGGLTYPQEVAPGEVYTREAFEAYFFAADVFVAIVGDGDTSQIDTVEDGREVALGLGEAKGAREWRDCVAGFYYVKPNYPGRSSHICNAGFVIPPTHRGRRYGPVLGRSYLHYAPQLGYQASVFNLVYVTNVASVRIWEALGFSKAGRIPKAGRLKSKDGEGEEYVDAWVFYKSFSN